MCTPRPRATLSFSRDLPIRRAAQVRQILPHSEGRGVGEHLVVPIVDTDLRNAPAGVDLLYRLAEHHRDVSEHRDERPGRKSDKK